MIFAEFIRIIRNFEFWILRYLEFHDYRNWSKYCGHNFKYTIWKMYLKLSIWGLNRGLFLLKVEVFNQRQLIEIL